MENSTRMFRVSLIAKWTFNSVVHVRHKNTLLNQNQITACVFCYRHQLLQPPIICFPFRSCSHLDHHLSRQIRSQVDSSEYRWLYSSPHMHPHFNNLYANEHIFHFCLQSTNVSPLLSSRGSISLIMRTLLDNKR